MPPAVAAPPIHKVPSGLVGAASRVQEVANPGLRNQQAVAEAKKAAGLKSEIEKLASQVAKLEQKLADKKAAGSSEAPDLAELIASLRQLTAAAGGEGPMTTSSGVIGAGVGTRPSSAPYRSLADTASVVSWSADAFGKAKTPGWYHTQRKELYQMRAARAAKDPTGCYISHSKSARAHASRHASVPRPSIRLSHDPIPVRGPGLSPPHASL